MTNKNEETRLALCESALRVLLISRYTTQSKFRREMEKLHPMNNEKLFNVWMHTVRTDLKEDGLIEEEGSLIKLTSKGRTVAKRRGYKTFLADMVSEEKRKKRLSYITVLTDASMLIVSIVGLFAEKHLFTSAAVPALFCFIIGVAIGRLWYILRKKRT